MSDGNGLAEAMLGLEGFREREVVETAEELTIIHSVNLEAVRYTTSRTRYIGRGYRGTRRNLGRRILAQSSWVAVVQREVYRTCPTPSSPVTSSLRTSLSKGYGADRTALLIGWCLKAPSPYSEQAFGSRIACLVPSARASANTSQNKHSADVESSEVGRYRTRRKMAQLEL